MPPDDMTTIYAVVAISMIVVVVLVDFALRHPPEGERATRNQVAALHVRSWPRAEVREFFG